MSNFNVIRRSQRGVKICPQCKTVNGYRSQHCKNRSCNRIFVKYSEMYSKKCTENNLVESCQIVTDGSDKIYSVRIRKSGPDYRGFVVFKNHNNDTSSRGMCYIKNCKLKNGEIAPSCHHIQTSINCNTTAKSLHISQSIVEKLNISHDVKQEISQSITDTPSGLIQRISKHVIVVRVERSKKHPLGYVHMLFQMDKNKYHCNCNMTKINISENEKSSNEKKHCLHFCLCACAFVSDPELYTEFHDFVNLIFTNETSLSTEIFSKDNDCTIDDEDNSLYISDDLPIYMELDDPPNSILKLKETEDGDEISTEVKDSTFQLNDVIFLEMDKCNQISNMSDVFDDDKPVDIKIMLADSSDLAKLPNSILKELPIYVDSSSSILIKYPNKTKKINDESNLTILCDEYGSLEDMIDKIDNSEKQTENIGDNIKVINSYSLSAYDEDLLLLNWNDCSKIDKSNECIITTDVLSKENDLENSKFLLNMRAKSEHDESDVITINATVTDPNKDFVDSSDGNISSQKNVEFMTTPSVIYNTMETQANLSFLHWLSGVTEQINQTMHFKFKGRPAPLKYQIPQTFFECLRDRMCPDMKKKRLPNHICEFQQTDTAPIGKFTRYTWNIEKLSQVKRIFDTAELPLEVIRYFTQNTDGTYAHCENPKQLVRSKTSISNKNNKNGYVNIHPGFLITYLKVGKMSVDDKNPVPFCIEWVPNILPKTKVGELTLKFEYGHRSNYHC